MRRVVVLLEAVCLVAGTRHGTAVLLRLVHVSQLLTSHDLLVLEEGELHFAHLLHDAFVEVLLPQKLLFKLTDSLHSSLALVSLLCGSRLDQQRGDLCRDFRLVTPNEIVNAFPLVVD